VVEAPFALFDEEVEVLLRDAVIASQMPLCLVPKVLDAVDMIPVLGEQFGMVDPDVLELGNVQHVIGPKAIGVDDGVRPYLVSYDGEKRFRACIWDDHNMDFAATFQETKNRNLACCTASSLALAAATKVAFINFNLAAHQTGF